MKELRGFLGLTVYYRRFIKSYASIATPLTELLKKDSFMWSPIAQEAFINLKKDTTDALVLALPNFKDEFVLETDASDLGIGAVLMQYEHPIAYFSKKLSLKMQKSSAYIRELYAITLEKSSSTNIKRVPFFTSGWSWRHPENHGKSCYSFLLVRNDD